MSGSSRAARALSRCVVILDAGIRISWATNPDGSYPGTEYHAREEAAFEERINEHAKEIESIFDEMEQAGRSFKSPEDAEFNVRAETGIHHGMPIVEVMVLASPALTEVELDTLAKRVSVVLKAECF